MIAEAETFHPEQLVFYFLIVHVLCSSLVPLAAVGEQLLHQTAAIIHKQLAGFD